MIILAQSIIAKYITQMLIENGKDNSGVVGLFPNAYMFKSQFGVTKYNKNLAFLKLKARLFIMSATNEPIHGIAMAIGEFVAIVPIAKARVISNMYCGKIDKPDITTYWIFPTCSILFVLKLYIIVGSE